MKQCAKCKEVKPLTEFNRHAKNKDGLQAYCGPCAHGWGQTEEQRRLARQRYKEKNRGKLIARKKAQAAVKVGFLIRQACEVCGEAKTEAHHDDYSKPFDVRWLCARHHAEWHRGRPLLPSPPPHQNHPRRAPVRPYARSPLLTQRPGFKLTVEQVREIRQTTGSSVVVGKRFGITGSMVLLIRRGERWRLTIGASA